VFRTRGLYGQISLSYFYHNPGNDQRVSWRARDRMDNRIPLVDKSSGTASPTQPIICQIWIEAFLDIGGQRLELHRYYDETSKLKVFESKILFN